MAKREKKKSQPADPETSLGPSHVSIAVVLEKLDGFPVPYEAMVTGEDKKVKVALHAAVNGAGLYIVINNTWYVIDTKKMLETAVKTLREALDI